MNQNAIYVYYSKLLKLSISTYVVSSPLFSLGFQSEVHVLFVQSLNIVDPLLKLC